MTEGFWKHLLPDKERLTEDSEREGVSENYVKVAKTPEVSRRQSSYLRHSKAAVLGPKADQILCLLWKSKGCKRRREMTEKRDFFSAPQLPNPGPENKRDNTSIITGKFQQRSKVSSAGCICGFTSFKCCKRRKRQVSLKLTPKELTKSLQTKK
ncbi:uncharacterized protein LOC141883646 isoform X2 [Acropora palmata]|uniref:uncharacterized protein LOC141883646 isoform X2 n=1 Tax=Acropora palmata TaxID=6131 RepID=UPI003DA16C73